MIFSTDDTIKLLTIVYIDGHPNNNQFSIDCQDESLIVTDEDIDNNQNGYEGYKILFKRQGMLELIMYQTYNI